MESFPPTRPPPPPHKAGRREWLHYSRECNSRNQSAGESSRAIFIISEDDSLARGRAGLHSDAAAGLFTAPSRKKITIPFVCVFESRIKTHFPSPSNEQRESHVSTRPTGGAAPSIPSPPAAVRWDRKNPKHHFLAASHAGEVRQGLPRLESDDVSDVKKLSSVPPVTPDTVDNLAISFKFPIS